MSPVFDKVHFHDLHVERYIPASHGFDWALWCQYESFRPEWFKMEDESQPGKYVEQTIFYLTSMSWMAITYGGDSDSDSLEVFARSPQVVVSHFIPKCYLRTFKFNVRICIYTCKHSKYSWWKKVMF